MFILAISSSVSSTAPWIPNKINPKSVAGIGMVISAQWELVLGNSFGYTALSAFGSSTSLLSFSYQIAQH